MAVKTLTGAADICSYCNFSESTLIMKVQREGFPAKKNDDGVFEADRQAVDNWIVGGKKAKDKSQVEAKPNKATTKIKK